MIDIPDPPAARLIEAWGRLSATSDRAEADPLVLDCARRLLADPGGEAAYVWVFGLVRMAGYLSWRPGQEAEQSALDALLAVDRALEDASCAHASHPYEDALKELVEDEVWLAAPDNPTTLVAGTPEDDTWLCPANVLGFARVTADVIAPFTVRGGIPELVPDAHADSLSSLSSVLNDHPYGDPGEELSFQAGNLPLHPTKGVRAGHVVTLHASQWYAISGRITEKSVFDDMIAGLEAVLPHLGDTTCKHTVAEHPELDSDPSGNAMTGYYLRSPGGRAELWSWDEDEGLARWLCPAFLRGLADEALVNLRNERNSRFDAQDNSSRDAEYAHPDGRLDIGKPPHSFEKPERGKS
ncbi:hypothetical protein [Streptomyces sp. NPDC090445]|uniref:hypothetical protein n=1 Tax=Streptomyces sp. NPDC090445 TaxID=3365963 RepID=UPI0037F8033C